jgi:Tfp pilus assembly protein PilF
MGKKASGGSTDISGLDRVFAELDDAPPGLHDVDPPADELPSGLPAPLIELYARCDGVRLFVDSLEIVPSRDVVADGGRWKFATHDGEALALDPRGKVWRSETSIEDDVCEATRIDRWLSGELDALALLYDGDGEYADDVFDEDGEILAIVREQMLRAQLKRDAAAPGPRWRLAHVLLEQGAVEDARNELEQVVADDPVFAWAWLDLARVSERLGESGNAIDEARMAAEAAEGVQHPQAGYFWSQVARLAVQAGDEMVRAEAATKASLLAPELKRSQIEGARERIEAGDRASAKGLVELLRAVWPRDLEVLDLAKQL